jgi:hypothetical protein
MQAQEQQSIHGNRFGAPAPILLPLGFNLKPTDCYACASACAHRPACAVPHLTGHDLQVRHGSSSSSSSSNRVRSLVQPRMTGVASPRKRRQRRQPRARSLAHTRLRCLQRRLLRPSSRETGQHALVVEAVAAEAAAAAWAPAAAALAHPRALRAVLASLSLTPRLPQSMVTTIWRATTSALNRIVWHSSSKTARRPAAVVTTRRQV